MRKQENKTEVKKVFKGIKKKKMKVVYMINTLEH